MASGVPVTLIDTDIKMIDVAGTFGAKVYFGDGTRIDMLRQAGAGQADLIMFCIDGDQLTAELMEAVHKAFPRATICARAFDRRTVLRLKGSPVSYMTREVMESAIGLARKALAALEISLDDIERAEAMYRARDRERMALQIETGDISSARDRIITEPEPGRTA